MKYYENAQSLITELDPCQTEKGIKPQIGASQSKTKADPDERQDTIVYHNRKG